MGTDLAAVGPSVLNKMNCSFIEAVCNVRYLAGHRTLKNLFNSSSSSVSYKGQVWPTGQIWPLSLFVNKKKFCWVLATPVCLFVACGCFCTRGAELNSCPQSPKIFTVLAIRVKVC